MTNPSDRFSIAVMICQNSLNTQQCSVESKLQEKQRLVEEMAGKVVAPAIRICGNNSIAKGSVALSKEEKEKWFWSKVIVRKNGCWEWSRLRNKQGYGGLRANGKYMLAHRFSWILTFGQIPDGINVLHKCDNPPCVNPRHLFLGTKQDNYDDMKAKGRERKAHGERHGFHKLTRENILEMRYLKKYGATYAFLARRFGVHKQTAYNVVKGRVWKHLCACT